MQCKIAVILGAALSAALSNPLRAQDEGPAPEAGKVLLLASERILEGDIERVGERYRIRRGTSEVWIPTVSAICLCANLDDAFAQMKKRANLGDPDERLRLARWCQLNGLREQALAEARYSLEMRPQHTATKSLIAALERTLNSAASAPAPSSPSKTAVTPPKSLTPIDVNADSLMQFTQKVQPILLNLCANCHGNGKGGDFQLYRSFEVGQRGATQRNLAAALAQVHMQKPAISPLLVKAVSAHGDSPNAPIRSQQSIPYRTLAEWVERTLATNPHLRENWTPLTKSPIEQPATTRKTEMNPTEAKTIEAKSTVVSRSIARTELPTAGQAVGTKKEADLSPAVVSEASAPPAVQSSPMPRDPFDPDIFNRQAHPQK